MKYHQWILCAALLALTACSTTPYPYPPQFVSTKDVPPTSIAVPPARYSAQHNADIAEIIAKQASITQADKDAITEEIPVTPEMIVTKVLGATFTRAALPETYDLLLKVGSDSWRISDASKEFWNTTRPWLNDKRIKLFVPPIYSGAYPSGHTTTGHVWAGVLAQLVPCQRDALFARAGAISEHRKLAGAHYAHDLRGGKILASIIVAKASATPAYQKELAEAKAELKAFMKK